MLQGVGSKVFRYESANEENIQAFADDRLYFAAPDVFNGPFEKSMYVDFYRAWELVSYELEHYERDYLGGKNKDSFRIITPFNREFFTKTSETPESRKVFEDKICLAIGDITGKLGANGRMTDFYEDYLSDNVWMEHGDHYRGFALMYDKAKLEKGVLYDPEDRELLKKASFGKVSYREARHDLGAELFKLLSQKSHNDIKNGLKPVLLQMLTTRNKSRASEKEWRLCCFPEDINTPDEAAYMSVKPEAVFVGEDIDHDVKLELCRIAKKKKLHVYEVYVDPATPFYRLDFRKIDNKGR